MSYYDKCKNARAFIVLLAALIALLLNIKYKRELVESLIIVLVVIIAFYIIATVAIKLVDKIIKMDSRKVEIDETDESEETDKSEGPDTTEGEANNQ